MERKKCEKQGNFNVELWVILKALHTAIREPLTANNTLVTIFCDS